ncbi:response regulator [Rhizobium oryzicola]|uniref:Response regulator n=1 Tax=Rhizobium oryzicola TaxID=1232668 RepID=A0ABT8SX44_9HYPH|nr:response regulator [Rhizobium oryzicola]MDO1582987.1 response regulator [Rhizobium oryzicola]
MLLALDMEDYLTEKGYYVVGPFGRVTQALETIHHTELAGAIVDLNLKGEYSFPVIDALQARGVPVIICSGYADLPDMKDKLAFLPLLPKPWSPDELNVLMVETFQFHQNVIGG